MPANSAAAFRRIIRFAFILALAGCGGAGARAAVPVAGELDIRVGHTPAAAAVDTIVHRAATAGGRTIEIAVVNRATVPVRLGEITVRLPWLPRESPGLLVATGGTTMAGWPPQVVEAAAPAAPPAESGTYLLARHGHGYSLVAFLSWNTFWSKLRYVAGGVVMTADGEGRVLKPGETVALEKLWLVDGQDWQDLLFGYADAIARELHIRLKPAPHFSGWSTWDYYGRKFTAANITDNLAALRRIAPGANLLQIDGGWWPQRGDFTQVRDNLKPDLKELAALIREQGMTAGLHFDGMRGDLQSDILKRHPEYFLHDDRGQIINVPQLNDGDRLAHTYFDFSQPGAVDYMREVARNIRRNWGYDYLKIDFLVDGIAAVIRRTALKDDPSRDIVPHDPGLTSVERLHRALRAWREGMGDDAYFLACSAPFGVVFGHADGMRTGYDVSPNFAGLRECAEATAGAFYLHGRVVYNDADYVVLRNREDEDETLVHNAAKHGSLTFNEAEMWADYVGLFGGTKLESDNLGTLRPERQALFQRALALPACSHFVPLDYWAHGRGRADAWHVLLGEAADGVYLALFNWSDHDRDYTFTTPPGLQLTGVAGSPRVTTTAPTALQVGLPARHAAIFRLPAGTSFDAARKSLRYAD